MEIWMIRQHLLTEDEPHELAAVLDESVLRSQRSNRSAMHAQLMWLAKTPEPPNFTAPILLPGARQGLTADSW
jgi:hypothetical protein